MYPLRNLGPASPNSGFRVRGARYREEKLKDIFFILVPCAFYLNTIYILATCPGRFPQSLSAGGGLTWLYQPETQRTRFRDCNEGRIDR